MKNTHLIFLYELGKIIIFHFSGETYQLVPMTLIGPLVEEQVQFGVVYSEGGNEAQNMPKGKL